MSTPLLLAKVNPPGSRGILRRPRLMDSLERGLDSRLILVSAGTGFGKTSILIDFAQKSQMALAWYFLDENDRDITIFCQYLLHALRRILPGFGQNFEDFLTQNAAELKHKASINRLAELLVYDLEQVIASTGDNFKDVLLVLDDYQFVDNASIGQFIDRLIWLLPNKIHLAIATRTTPRNLLLAPLVVRRLIVTIGASELAFTAQEIYQLLSEQYQTENEELAKELASFSEGWAMALTLAISQTMSQKENWSQFRPGPSGFFADELFTYLAQEVYDQQTPAVQEFLVKTSVLQYLTPDMCNRLLENFAESLDSRAVLKQLETSNLFIKSLENKTQTYQYHSLFKTFLITRLKEETDLYKQLLGRAAELEKELGNYIGAVQLYVEANEMSNAANLLSQVAQQLYQAGRTEVLSQMLDSIPEGYHKSSPHLLSCRAQLLLDKGENAPALTLYIEAEHLYRKEQSVDYAAYASAQQAQLMLRTGQRREALAICSRLFLELGMLLRTEIGQKAVAAAKLVTGIISIETGNIGEAEKNLRDAAEIYKALNSEYYLALIDSFFGTLYFQEGRLLRSNIYTERAMNYFAKIGNASREAYQRTNLAINHYSQGNYQLAETQLDVTLSLARELKDEYLSLFALTYLANVYRDTLRFTKALPTYEYALELTRKKQIRKMELLVLNDQATAYILQSKREEARNLVNLSLELARDFDLPERAGYSYRNLSWLELENRGFKRALSYIEQSTQIFDNAKLMAEVARCKLTQGVILLAMGEPRKALAILTESIETSAELGYSAYLPFELKWANNLFEYASQKKVSEAVELFLRQQGFISSLPTFGLATDFATEAAEPAAKEPIRLQDRLNQRNAKTPAIVAAPVQTGSPGLRLYSLDAARVVVGDVEVKQWRNNKAREALFYIIDHGSCTRDELAEAIWPDDSSQALYNAIFLLRKAISPVTISLTAGRYSLEGEVWYDVAEFEREVKQAISQPDFSLERLTNALALYKRDYLSQFYSNWSIERQQQIQDLYLKGLEKLARYYQSRGQQTEAIVYWNQLLLKDSYNETAYQATINCYLELGNRSEALKQATVCLKALAELDLKPSAETKILLQKLA